MGGHGRSRTHWPVLGFMSLLWLTGLGAAPVAGQQAEAPARLELGRSLEFLPQQPPLGREAVAAHVGLALVARLELMPVSDGPLTVSVRSTDADPVVRLLSDGGTVLMQNDDGGLDWNARLVVDAARDAPLQLLVGFKLAVDGALTVDARVGDVPLPEGADLAFALMDHNAAKGEAYLRRGESLRAAVAFHEEGKLAFNLGSHARCEQAYRKVMPLAEELQHVLLRTLAQGWIGAVKVETGELDDAAPLLEAALAGAMELQHKPIELFVCAHSGRLHRQLGDLPLARAFTERGLGITRELGDRSNEAILCSRMAELCEDAGDRAGADSWLVAALEIGRESGSPDLLSTLLLDAGRISELRSAFGPARELLEEALALATQPNDVAAIQGHLGNLAHEAGDVLTAMEFYEAVLEKARWLGNASNEVTALVALARCDVRLNDLQQARARLELAFPILERMDAGRQRVTLNREVAVLLSDLGEYAAARTLLDEVLAEAERSDDEKLRALAGNTEVVWYYRQGLYEEGLPVARWLADVSPRLDERERGAALEGLAEFLVRLGRFEEARGPAEESVELGRRSGNAWQLQSTLLTLVEIVAQDGDVARLARILAEAEDCFDRLPLDQLDPEAGARLRSRNLLAEWDHWNQEYVAMASSRLPPDDGARADIIQQGFVRAGFWKGRSLLRGIAEHRRGGRSAEVLGARLRWRESQAERDALLAEIARREREGAARVDLARLRHRAEELAETIQSTIAQLPARELALDLPQGVAPGELSALLGDDVLIDFADGRKDVFAYVLTESGLEFHRVGERQSVRRLVDGYVGGMSRPGELAPLEQVVREGRQLYELLLAPLVDGHAPEARLVIVPTAALAGLPFEALVTHAPARPKLFSEVEFLVDSREVVYAPSAPVLVALAQQGDRSRPGPALILGDPAYVARPVALAARAASDPSRSLLRPAVWERLPGTRKEAVAIAGILEDARSPAASPAEKMDLESALTEQDLSLETDAFSLHLGERATAGRMQGDLRRYAVIHCASHGWVDKQDPRGSGLALTPTDEEDGFLSVADILELDLDAELAVLSACQTGQGVVLRGEGMQSVARAFLYAGSRTVVASLWPVDDRETEAVMTHFYRRFLEDDVRVSTALRAARLALRQDPGEGQAFRGLGRGSLLPGSRSQLPKSDRIGHPYFWAPFVSIGAIGR